MEPSFDGSKDTSAGGRMVGHGDDDRLLISEALLENSMVTRAG